MAKKRTTKRKATRKSTSTKRKATRKSTSTKRKAKKPFGGCLLYTTPRTRD